MVEEVFSVIAHFSAVLPCLCLTDGRIMEINLSFVCEREGTNMRGEKKTKQVKKKEKNTKNQQTTNKPKSTPCTGVKRRSIRDIHSS